MDRKLFIVHLFVYIILCAILWIGSLAAFLLIPSSSSYKDGDWTGQFIPNYDQNDGNVLFDPHSHTTQSSGVLTPEQNLQYHIAMGYNSCVITDKLGKNGGWENSFEAQRIARDKYNNTIKVLIGIEYGSNRGHLNIILPPVNTSSISLLPYYGSNPTNEQLQDFIDQVHFYGGIVILDHLIYSYDVMPTHPSRQSFAEWGIDYIEIMNGGVFDYESYQFCLENNIGMIGTSGMHVPDKDPLQGWTLINVEEFTEEVIFSQLKGKNTSLVYQAFPAPYQEIHNINYWYYIFLPFILFGRLLADYFPGGVTINYMGLIVLGFYSLLLFLVFEMISNKFLNWMQRKE
jgi:hypothetical protein